MKVFMKSSWGFDQGGRITTPGTIEPKPPLVGYKKPEFDNSTYSVGFDVDGMGLDLGGIAKGWAVDQAMEKIMARGIRNAIIDAGGDLRIIGSRPVPSLISGIATGVLTNLVLLRWQWCFRGVT